MVSLCRVIIAFQLHHVASMHMPLIIVLQTNMLLQACSLLFCLEDFTRMNATSLHASASSVFHFGLLFWWNARCCFEASTSSSMAATNPAALVWWHKHHDCGVGGIINDVEYHTICHDNMSSPSIVLLSIAAVIQLVAQCCATVHLASLLGCGSGTGW